MESPTQLCWRYHSLPLRQLYEVTPKMIYSNVSLVTFCTLLASRIRNYPKEYNSILGPTAKPLSRPLEMLTESPAGPLACGRTLSDNDCNHRLKKACDRTQPIIAVIYVILIFREIFYKIKQSFLILQTIHLTSDSSMKLCDSYCNDFAIYFWYFFCPFREVDPSPRPVHSRQTCITQSVKIWHDINWHQLARWQHRQPCSIMLYTIPKNTNEQGRESLNSKTSYNQILSSLDAVKIDIITFVLVWNLTCISAVLLPRCLLNFKAIRALKSFYAGSRFYEIWCSEVLLLSEPRRRVYLVVAEGQGQLAWIKYRKQTKHTTATTPRQILAARPLSIDINSISIQQLFSDQYIIDIDLKFAIKYNELNHLRWLLRKQYFRSTASEAIHFWRAGCHKGNMYIYFGCLPGKLSWQQAMDWQQLTKQPVSVTRELLNFSCFQIVLKWNL